MVWGANVGHVIGNAALTVLDACEEVDTEQMRSYLKPGSKISCDF